MAKILTISKLLQELSPLRSKKMIGLVTGCFDVLHIGHIEFLKYAKEQVDILIVMTSIHNFSSLGANKYYDKVTKQISPHYMFVAVRTDAFRSQRETKAKKVGATLVEFRQKHIRSSTNIVNKVIKADL